MPDPFRWDALCSLMSTYRCGETTTLPHTRQITWMLLAYSWGREMLKARSLAA
jgi:hypothetical protein